MLNNNLRDIIIINTYKYNILLIVKLVEFNSDLKQERCGVMYNMLSLCQELQRLTAGLSNQKVKSALWTTLPSQVAPSSLINQQRHDGAEFSDVEFLKGCWGMARLTSCGNQFSPWTVKTKKMKKSFFCFLFFLRPKPAKTSASFRWVKTCTFYFFSLVWSSCFVLYHPTEGGLVLARPRV